MMQRRQRYDSQVNASCRGETVAVMFAKERLSLFIADAKVFCDKVLSSQVLCTKVLSSQVLCTKVQLRGRGLVSHAKTLIGGAFVHE